MNNDIWNERRKKLQFELCEVALALSEHTGAVGFECPIDGTSPLLVVSLSSTTELASKEIELTKARIEILRLRDELKNYVHNLGVWIDAKKLYLRMR